MNMMMPPAAGSILAAYASITTFVMVLQTMLNQLVPRQAQHYLINLLHRYFRPRQTNATIVIEERDGMTTNEVYGAAETYLSTKIRHNIHRLKVIKRHRDPDLTIRFAQCETIPDSFQGIHLEWRFIRKERTKDSKVINHETNDIYLQSEKCYFELSYDRCHKDAVLDSYIPFVLHTAQEIRSQKKVIKLHTLASPNSYITTVVWDSINLEHPSTFDTLAMEPSQKKSIIDDLDRFISRKDFYRKVGRAWKRGYLLYGPPGTGKSSLIAAMANYLKFDIYDLELTNVRRDSDLRNVLLRTANRSILVIEDIDCSVDLPERKDHTASSDKLGSPRREQLFTLSGLLNFIDGLWSSCGDERIIIFTTNNKEKLNPALLRPGRMDMHIQMSYLTPAGFKLLASTYLNVCNEHQLFPEIEDVIRRTKVTPAEVAEELMKSEDADAALDGLINFLRDKETMNKTSEAAKDEGIEVSSDTELDEETAKDDQGTRVDYLQLCFHENASEILGF